MGTHARRGRRGRSSRSPAAQQDSLGPSRLVGGADHLFLGDLVRAVDAIAARCDELSERVANLEVIADDLARAFGQEITQLRAAVERTAEQESGTSPPSTQ